MNKKSSEVQTPGDIPETAQEVVSRHEARWTHDYDKWVWANYSALIEAHLRLNDPQIYGWYADKTDFFGQMMDLGAMSSYPESFEYAAARSTLRSYEYSDTEFEREEEVTKLTDKLLRMVKESKLPPDQVHSYFCDAIEDLYDFPRDGLEIDVDDYRERLLSLPNPLRSGLPYDRQQT